MVELSPDPDGLIRRGSLAYHDAVKEKNKIEIFGKFGNFLETRQAEQVPWQDLGPHKGPFRHRSFGCDTKQS